jgi:hypothetical protein
MLDIVQQPERAIRSLRHDIIRYFRRAAAEGLAVPGQIEIASELSMSTDAFQRHLRELKDEGVIAEEMTPTTRRYVVPSFGATAPAPRYRRHRGAAPSPTQGTRACMCCGLLFHSTHKHHRLCDVCKRG